MFIKAHLFLVFILVVFYNAAAQQDVSLLIQEVDQLAKTIASTKTQIDSIRNDSLQISNEIAQSQAKITSAISMRNMQLSSINDEHRSLTTTINNLKSDSISEEKIYSDQVKATTSQLQKIDTQIIILQKKTSSIKTVSTDNSTVHDKKIEALTRDISRVDSLLLQKEEKHNSILDLSVELKKDSVVAEEKNSDRREDIENEFTIYNKNMEALAKSQELGLQQIEKSKEDSVASVKQYVIQIQQLSLELKQLEDIIKKQLDSQKIMTPEFEKLQKIVATEQKMYLSKRNPLDSTIKSIDKEILEITERMKSLEVFKSKISLDSSVVKIENDMDSLYQHTAKGKKAAKKALVEKENELKTILSELDTYLKNPIVVQLDAQMLGKTVDQKRKQIHEELNTLSNRKISAESQLVQTKEQLSKVQLAEPQSKTPSSVRFNEVEAIMKNYQNDILQKNEKITGLTQQIQTINETMSREQKLLSQDMDRARITYNEALIQKQVAESKKIQLTAKKVHADSVLTSNRVKISQAINSLNEQIRTLQQEITNLKSQKLSLSKDVEATLALKESEKQKREKEQQSADSVLAYDSQLNQNLMSTKTELENQLESLRKEHTTLRLGYESSITKANNTVAETQQKKQELKTSESDIETEITVKNREKLAKSSIQISELNRLLAKTEQRFQLITEISDKQSAQRLIELIYGMLGEGLNTEAVKLFTERKSSLIKFLDNEAYQTIESVFNEQ